MRKTIVVDFDGTICKDAFPDVGPPEPGVREALQKFKDLGYVVKIHTCRTASYWDQDRTDHVELVQRFLEENGIPYDELILNMDKPIAAFYIDDRGIQYQRNWNEIAQQIEMMT